MDFSKHNLFFTVGLNIGQPDFGIPLRGIELADGRAARALEYWPAQTDHRGSQLHDDWPVARPSTPCGETRYTTKTVSS